MGTCLSCLGLRDDSNEAERSHLFSTDDTYNATGHGYGGTSQSLSTRHLNPEEAKREQEALEGITRWTTDTVVDIFPHTTNNLPHLSSSQQNLTSMAGPTLYDHIPGDKSTKQIRIYPASRPPSEASRQASIRSKSSSRGDGSGGVSGNQPRIFKTLDLGIGD